MKIADLQDKKGEVNIELKVIYDQMPEQQRWGKKMKTIVVVDADAEEGGESALLDLYDEDVDKYKFQDKMRAINCYSKKITNNRGEQMLITYGFKGKELVGHYEKVENGT